MKTLRDVARALDLPLWQIAHAASSGKLKTHQRIVGGKRFVTDAALAEFKTTHIDPVRETEDRVAA